MKTFKEFTVKVENSELRGFIKSEIATTRMISQILKQIRKQEEKTSVKEEDFEQIIMF